MLFAAPSLLPYLACPTARCPHWSRRRRRHRLFPDDDDFALHEEEASCFPKVRELENVEAAYYYCKASSLHFWPSLEDVLG